MTADMNNRPISRLFANEVKLEGKAIRSDL